MSLLLRSTLFSVLLTACGGGLDPYSERTNLLDLAAEQNGSSADSDDRSDSDDGTDGSDDGTDGSEDGTDGSEDGTDGSDDGTDDLEACTTGNGQAGAIDCNGACMPTAFLGDGYCDSGTGGGADFACDTYDFDDGDCDAGTVPDPTPPATPAPTTPAPTTPAPTTPAPECTTAAGAPGVYDCDGVCHPDAFIGDGYCDDGSTDANFQCAQYNNDGGDCGAAPTTPAPTTPAPTTPAPTTPVPTGPVTGDTCITTDGDLGAVDCSGSCAPASWIGDNYCDDGTGEADFMCFEFLFDIGDCLP